MNFNASIGLVCFISSMPKHNSQLRIALSRQPVDLGPSTGRGDADTLEARTPTNKVFGPVLDIDDGPFVHDEAELLVMVRCD
jgi:hypothetical protein